MTTVWPVLALSLLGSPHCAAMCGLVAGAAAPNARTAVWYHLARLGGYVAIGAVAGAIGLYADRVGVAIGLAGVASRVAGAALILAGVLGLLRASGVARFGSIETHRWVARVASVVREASPVRRAAALGALTALFPCGWLLAFVAGAAGTGHPASGALAMALFWAGTVPALAGASAIVRRLAGPLQRRLPLIGAVALIVFGLVTALHRPAPMGSHRHDSDVHAR